MLCDGVIDHLIIAVKARGQVSGKVFGMSALLEDSKAVHVPNDWTFHPRLHVVARPRAVFLMGETNLL